MRYVVKLGDKVYLPRKTDYSAFQENLPVTIFSAATFRTKKAAIKALNEASKKGFPANNPVYEKRFMRAGP